MSLRSLVGREREMQIFTDMLDGVHEHGSCLVVRGDPGIGKSALLSAARTSAQSIGMSVLSATGVHSEAILPLAWLRHLLQPLLAGVSQLPPSSEKP